MASGLSTVSDPALKRRGLHLTRTLARSRKVDTTGRLTSGNYPYNFRSLAAHRERRHKFYMPEQLPAHLPISAWNNPVSRGNHRQQTVSQGEPRVPLHLACSTCIISWLSRLSLNIRAVSTRIVHSSPLSRTAILSSPG
jgi:hypothetical protein